MEGHISGQQPKTPFCKSASMKVAHEQSRLAPQQLAGEKLRYHKASIGVAGRPDEQDCSLFGPSVVPPCHSGDKTPMQQIRLQLRAFLPS
jgi:hypothetical protein